MLEYKSKDFIKSDSYVHVFKMADLVNKEIHVHDFIEIVYVLSGKAVEKINGFEFKVKQGDLLFINYGCTHSFDFEGNFSYINVCFNPKLLGRAISKDVAFPLLSLTAFDELKSSMVTNLNFSGNARGEIEAVLFAMLNEEKRELPFYNSMLESYMNVLLGLILRKYMSKGMFDDLDGVWGDLIEYIENNLDSKLTLKDLAKKCFYNPAYFSRIFKEKFKVTLSEYIMRRRIELAAKLLVETDNTIEMVSNMVGYETISAFYRAFQIIMGVSVTEFKRR